MFNSKQIKICYGLIIYIQCYPMSSNIMIFIKINYISTVFTAGPSPLGRILLLLGRLSLLKTPLNLGSFDNILVFQRLLKDVPEESNFS